MRSPEAHRTRTLWLSSVLHGFTHVFHVALLPLYLLIQADLQLASVDQATLLVTVMMAAYFLPSYAMGILADRFSRKRLLALGLTLNSLGFVGLSFAPGYGLALPCVVLAGLGGSFFHPAATAMVARLYPTGTGRALGLLGVGASVGFFFGPIYTGWRAAASGWRAPVLELGLLGLVTAGLFAWLAEERPGDRHAHTRHAPAERMFATPALWALFVGASFAFALRDFTGAAMGSLGSLFLQQAHGYDARVTGLFLSVIFLASMISNPLFGGLSDRGRIRWTFVALLAAAAMVFLFPRVGAGWSVAVFAAYGFFFMASYPMVEAALMESVHDSVRGRVFGFFITVGGLVGNLSHWAVGRWVKGLGPAAGSVESYYPGYAALAALVLVSLGGLACLHGIRRRERPTGAAAMPGAVALQTPDAP